MKPTFNKKCGSFNKLVSAAMSIIFISYSLYNVDPASAATITPAEPLYNIKEITIPKDNGLIRESFQGTNGRLIIHIQDAHVNYEAQKNIVRILKRLVEECGIRLVLSEGGWGDIGLSFLRHFSTPDKRERIADEYLKKGKIAGEEYLDIVSEPSPGFRLYGIEDERLYRSNLGQFLKIDKFADRAGDFAASLHRALAVLKDRLYSDGLKEYEKKRLAYDNGELDIISYCEYLRKAVIARSAEGATKQSKEEIEKLLRLKRLEESIDFKRVNIERDDFIGLLLKKLPQESLNTLLKKSLDFRSGAATAAAYYGFLQELNKEAGIDVRDYPNLHIYFYYLKFYSTLERDKLFSEIGLLEEGARDLLCENDIQRELGRITEDLKLVKNFIDLSLSPDDLKRYRSNKKRYNLKRYSRFINGLAKDKNIQEAFLRYSSVVDRNLRRFERFYDIAKKRDKVFFKNAARIMKEKDQKTAVLIAGGFHTEELMPLFKEEGFSYIVITPKAACKSNLSLYHSLLRGELAPEEKEAEAALGLLRIQALVRRVPTFQTLVEGIVGDLREVGAAELLEDMEEGLPELLRRQLNEGRVRLELDDDKVIAVNTDGRPTWEFLIKDGAWQRAVISYAQKPSPAPAGTPRLAAMTPEEEGLEKSGLALDRKIDESIIIDSIVEVKVLDIRGKEKERQGRGFHATRTRLAVYAPPEVRIYREEVYLDPARKEETDRKFAEAPKGGGQFGLRIWRKMGKSIVLMIGDARVVVTPIPVAKHTKLVKLLVNAPPYIPAHREEVQRRIEGEDPGQEGPRRRPRGMSPQDRGSDSAEFDEGIPAGQDMREFSPWMNDRDFLGIGDNITVQAYNLIFSGEDDSRHIDSADLIVQGPATVYTEEDYDDPGRKETASGTQVCFRRKVGEGLVIESEEGVVTVRVTTAPGRPNSLRLIVSGLQDISASHVKAIRHNAPSTPGIIYEEDERMVVGRDKDIEVKVLRRHPFSVLLAITIPEAASISYGKDDGVRFDQAGTHLLACGHSERFMITTRDGDSTDIFVITNPKYSKTLLFKSSSLEGAMPVQKKSAISEGGEGLKGVIVSRREGESIAIGRGVEVKVLQGVSHGTLLDVKIPGGIAVACDDLKIEKEDTYTFLRSREESLLFRVKGGTAIVKISNQWPSETRFWVHVPEPDFTEEDLARCFVGDPEEIRKRGILQNMTRGLNEGDEELDWIWQSMLKDNLALELEHDRIIAVLKEEKDVIGEFLIEKGESGMWRRIKKMECGRADRDSVIIDGEIAVQPYNFEFLDGGAINAISMFVQGPADAYKEEDYRDPEKRDKIGGRQVRFNRRVGKTIIIRTGEDVVRIRVATVPDRPSLLRLIAYAPVHMKVSRAKPGRRRPPRKSSTFVRNNGQSIVIGEKRDIEVRVIKKYPYNAILAITIPKGVSVYYGEEGEICLDQPGTNLLACGNNERFRIEAGRGASVEIYTVVIKEYPDSVKFKIPTVSGVNENLGLGVYDSEADEEAIYMKAVRESAKEELVEYFKMDPEEAGEIVRGILRSRITFERELISYQPTDKEVSAYRGAPRTSAAVEVENVEMIGPDEKFTLQIILTDGRDPVEVEYSDERDLAKSNEELAQKLTKELQPEGLTFRSEIIAGKESVICEYLDSSTILYPDEVTEETFKQEAFNRSCLFFVHTRRFSLTSCTFCATSSGVFSPMMMDCMPLSKNSITCEYSFTGSRSGCVVLSMSSAN
ncbi:carbon storage regulator [Omnitrophica bacterium]|nr:carbon storage regulator [Candidatus Omnitrophota bacterium]